jgi:hypothetical protein
MRLPVWAKQEQLVASDGASDDIFGWSVAVSGDAIWFFFVGTGERFTADTCNSRTNFDTKLSTFAGFDCNGLVCLDGVDDGCQ